jgi:hypothetical protein
MRTPKLAEYLISRHSGLRIRRAIGKRVVHSGAEIEPALSALGRMEAGTVPKPPLIFDCQEFRH